MRTTKTKPEFGDRQISNGFLFLPKTINDEKETGRTEVGTRWFEFAEWEEEWVDGYEGGFWQGVCWTD